MQTKWYHYILGFLAGFFLTNFLPHYICGITGRPFPTPFATPPGVGLSAPVTNLLWALINLVIGGLFLYYSRINQHGKRVWVPFFLGFLAMSFVLATHFDRANKIRNKAHTNQAKMLKR